MDDIDFNSLPDQFVLKCTHDSGGVVICKDKSNFDKEAAIKKLKHCYKRNYYLNTREPAYAATILLCLKKNEDKVQCNTWISNIGDCSFGIFFLHCMVLWIVKKILSMVGIDHCWIAFWILTFLLTTFISYMLVMLIRNKVGDMKKLRWIGFD